MLTVVALPFFKASLGFFFVFRDAGMFVERWGEYKLSLLAMNVVCVLCLWFDAHEWGFYKDCGDDINKFLIGRPPHMLYKMQTAVLCTASRCSKIWWWGI